MARGESGMKIGQREQVKQEIMKHLEDCEIRFFDYVMDEDLGASGRERCCDYSHSVPLTKKDVTEEIEELERVLRLLKKLRSVL